MTQKQLALDAVVFDMDGVVTDTAIAHAAAWKALFDGVLAAHGDARPFSDEDYRAHVDGKPRYEGVAGFLAARAIALPQGAPSDPPEAETICGLGNRKNLIFNDWLARNRVEAFPGTLALMDTLTGAGIALGVFSASRNAEAVLASAGVRGRFAAKVDGVEAAEGGLPGKPDPAVLVECARRLGAVPARTAVIEDARAGVAAGRAGGFAAVIGVDRDGDGDGLAASGADLVVADLAELVLAPGGHLAVRTHAGAPGFEDEAEALRARLEGRRPAVFLDYDGTLSPIVPDPKDAILGPSMREALAAVAARAPVAIVSGRDLPDVRALVGDDSLYFAGSHGFDLAGPGGWRETVEAGRAFQPALAAAADDLERAVAGIPGARVERKGFSLALHYRHVAPEREDEIAEALAGVMEGHGRLKASGGKKVYDIKPRTDWHKGRAVLSLLTELKLDGPDVLPIYLGDDTTDEDAFRAIADRGIGLVVRDRDRPERRTAATLALDGTEGVERFLRWFAGAFGERYDPR